MNVEITEEQIKKYYEYAFSESFIRDTEDQLVQLLKARHERYPNEISNQSWRDFSDFVIKRRGYGFLMDDKKSQQVIDDQKTYDHFGPNTCIGYKGKIEVI